MEMLKDVKSSIMVYGTVLTLDLINNNLHGSLIICPISSVLSLGKDAVELITILLVILCRGINNMRQAACWYVVRRHLESLDYHPIKQKYLLENIKNLLIIATCE